MYIFSFVGTYYDFYIVFLSPPNCCQDRNLSKNWRDRNSTLFLKRMFLNSEYIFVFIYCSYFILNILFFSTMSTVKLVESIGTNIFYSAIDIELCISENWGNVYPVTSISRIDVFHRISRIM